MNLQQAAITFTTETNEEKRQEAITKKAARDTFQFINLSFVAIALLAMVAV